ncbi:MAG: hypothetical protein JXB05_22310, partial [Myxococcaceae bacterium]|nr:hypothetical protein [Myxococcaceae bacterium]
APTPGERRSVFSTCLLRRHATLTQHGWRKLLTTRDHGVKMWRRRESNPQQGDGKTPKRKLLLIGGNRLSAKVEPKAGGTQSDEASIVPPKLVLPRPEACARHLLEA